MRFSFKISLLLIMVVVGGYYAYLHSQVLQIGHPITQDEPGFVEITAAGDSYSEAGVATCANVYGPAYPQFAGLFTRFISNAYVAHRWANTVALLSTLLVLAWVLRGEGVDWLSSAGGLVVFYGLNVSSHSLAASADFLAMGCYIAALAAGRKGSHLGLALCLVLSLAGGLAKLYAVLGWFTVASYLWFFGDRRRLLAFLVASVSATLLLGGLLQRFAPAYFLSTVVVQATAVSSNFDALWRQTAEFLTLTGGLVLLAFWGRSLRGKPPRLDFWEWAALVAAAVLLGKLGWHEGNYLVYYYHLLLGPLVVVALRRMKLCPMAGPVLLGANLLVLGWQLPSLPGNDNWRSLELAAADSSGRVLADPFFAPFTTARSNIELLEYGQTASILQGLDHRADPGASPYRELHRRLLDAAEEKKKRIAAEEFEAIYLCYQNLPRGLAWGYDRERYAAVLSAHYTARGEITIYPYCAPFWDRKRHGEYAYHVVKWVPKTRVAPNATVEK